MRSNYAETFKTHLILIIVILYNVNERGVRAVSGVKQVGSIISSERITMCDL
jgi:hypothetical protein